MFTLLSLESRQIHPYELVKLRQCMQNAARFKELRIASLVTSLRNKRVAQQNDAPADHTKDKSCDPDYNPEDHETTEADLCETNNTKVLISIILF
jgi:hypothetical protein